MSLRLSLFTAGFSSSLLFGTLSPVITNAQTIRPELRSGSTGTSVRELQATLRLLGYYTSDVTGNYDEATVIAVYRFQKAAQLPETGVMDQTTWSTLFPTIATSSTPIESTTATAADAPATTTETTSQTTTATETKTPPKTTSSSTSQPIAENLPLLKEGMSGEAVTLLQNKLKAKGFFFGVVDGVYGPQTLGAVIAAQTAFKIDGDGIVGYHTWKKLLD